ncbi:MAG TPA: transposase [Thermoanaerobaculia bacterium]|nr:transposase [Thermoanaerobaculia bacterium]
MTAWPHAPRHWTVSPGTFMVTGATLHKHPFFDTPSKLDLVLDLLLMFADRYRWSLEAWAILSNHYHFVARSPEENSLRELIRDFHSAVGRQLNRAEGIVGRQVLYQFWDTALTFERSYLARLKYVHWNPVHHGLVEDATLYKWCSAAWFERETSAAFVKTVYGLRIDRINVIDDF